MLTSTSEGRDKNEQNRVSAHNLCFFHTNKAPALQQMNFCRWEAHASCLFSLTQPGGKYMGEERELNYGGLNFPECLWERGKDSSV